MLRWISLIAAVFLGAAVIASADSIYPPPPLPTASTNTATVGSAGSSTNNNIPQWSGTSGNTLGTGITPGTDVTSLLGANASATTWVCAVLSDSGPYCNASKGQLPGTTTNDNASAGDVGETIAAPASGTGTPGFTNGSAVITDSGTCAAGQTTGCVGIGSLVTFSNSGGSLPTNFSSSTNYYVISTGFTAGTSYEVATSPTGSAITAGSAGSGTQSRSGTSQGLSNNTPLTLAAVSLTAGQWSCQGWVEHNLSSATTTFQESWIGPNNNSSTGRITESIVFDSYAFTTSSPTIIGPTGAIPLKLSGTTEEYLVVNDSLTAGSATAAGSLVCTRTR